VHIEWIFQRGEPFGARCRASFAARVEREPQHLDQTHHLGPGRHMREAGPRSQGGLIEIVQRGQSAGKKLSVDQAFGETLRAAKAQTR
jgi:hypothetical protein